ncbi:MAG: GDP-mannose 4,6-dehydratase [Verrucomicrobiota bacterium]|nr:GDP-mannose 4,6-dehydratase [Verrucomicrobiota bacterium]
MPKALITGISGQDGSYLAEFLLDKGYEVHGIVRRPIEENFWRIEFIRPQISLHFGDMLDLSALISLFEKVQPDEVYNLASQSSVGESWKQAILTGEFNAMGVTRMLEGIRLVNKKIKFYQASSSEMYGKVREPVQNEDTPFYPRSPYGVAKVYGHFITVNYRESHGIYACSGILFNHESPRRGKEFVTRKIAHAVARIALGLSKELALGNIDVSRDFGYAKEYVEAMWLMLQQKEADDFVIATGASHSLRDFIEVAFRHAGLQSEQFIRIDPELFRPAEVDIVCGDPSKAKNKLGWVARTPFENIVTLMVDAEMELLRHTK